jgi:hypothetical protein
MGSGRFSFDAYAAYSSATVGRSTDDVFRTSAKAARGRAPELLDPLNVKKDVNGVRMRESRDSTDNPLSTPLIVALDVTGSMGMLADHLAREGLGTLFKAILDRKPITDPHLMFMALGDANCDSAPLQVSQFEADARIIEQLAEIWIEKGGGGNSFESYNLPWYFAARHTVHDAFQKRGKKGYLFTVGDERVPTALTANQIRHFIGDDVEKEVSTKEALVWAQERYEVFHVIVEEGSHCTFDRDGVVRTWTELLGQRALLLSDHKKLSEVIVSAIQVLEGDHPDKVADSWGDSKTSEVVHAAVKGLLPLPPPGADAGRRRLT